MEEIHWKPVFGYETEYEMSTKGVVRGVERWVERTGTSPLHIRSKIITPQLSIRRAGDIGYWRVGLCKACKRKYHFLHRLLAETFIPNPNNLPQVNHKDGNKHNNTLENLEWVTCADNVIHAYEKGLNPDRKGIKYIAYSKLSEDDVRRIRSVGDKYTTTELATHYGVSSNHILYVLKRKVWRNII